MINPTVRTEVDRDPEFARWIVDVPGADTIRQCIHCGVCSGSCPLSTYMDRSPRELMHLAKEGYKQEVLSSFTIWLCTSCYSCAVKCPRQIKVTDVMYALKRRAIEEGTYPKRFPIPVLAREFHRMVRSNGRISESQLALRMMLRTNLKGLFAMGGIGRRLLRTGRFQFKAERIRQRKELAHVLDSVAGNGGGDKR